MAWIEVHQSLPRHPKLLHLARGLNENRLTTTTRLLLLWLWALDVTNDGVLRDVAAEDIAAVMEWHKPADKLCDLLVATGWLDVSSEANYVIHNWQDYMGKLQAKRQLTLEQKRAGGKARMSLLTPAQRSTLGKQAAHAKKASLDNQQTTSNQLVTQPATVPNQPNHITKELDKKLPEWLNLETWEGFVSMRKKIRKPMTEYAEHLMLRDLSKWREEGRDPNRLLEDAIIGGWQKPVIKENGGNGNGHKTGFNTGNPRQLPPRTTYTRPEDLRIGLAGADAERPAG